MPPHAEGKKRIDVELGVVKMMALLDSLYQGIVNLGRVLTIGFGSFWVLDGSLTPGAMYAIYLYVEQMVRPMMDIPQFFIAGKQVSVCIDRLEAMADFEQGFVDGEGGSEPVEGVEVVSVENVTFAYSGEQSQGREVLQQTLPRRERSFGIRLALTETGTFFRYSARIWADSW